MLIWFKTHWIKEGSCERCNLISYVLPKALPKALAEIEMGRCGLDWVKFSVLKQGFPSPRNNLIFPFPRASCCRSFLRRWRKQQRFAVIGKPLIFIELSYAHVLVI